VIQLTRRALSAMKLCLSPAAFLVAFTTPALATRNSFIKHRSYALNHGLISPKLDPESDKVFFGHDYPDNLAGKGNLKPEFGHPYPAVQDTNEFDRDYVKDENNDGGEWKAQMDYDLMRTKLSKARDDMEHAQAAREKAQDRYRQAKKKEADAMEEAGVAKDKIAKARAAAKSAEKDASDAKDATDKAEEEDIEEMRKAVEAEGKKGKAGKTDEADAKDSTEATNTGAAKSGENSKEASKTDESVDKVEAAAAKVKKEMADLEKCEKELKDAKERLNELMVEEDKVARDHKTQVDGKKAQIDKEKAEVSKEESEAAAEVSKDKKDKEAWEALSAAEKKKLSEEEKAHEAAAAKAKLESTDLDKLESDLKAAEKHLRKFRRAEDADGGVYNEKPCKESTNPPATLQPCVKSGAMERTVPAATMSLVVAGLTMYVL